MQILDKRRYFSELLEGGVHMRCPTVMAFKTIDFAVSRYFPTNKIHQEIQ
jgi:hypothetical protein